MDPNETFATMVTLAGRILADFDSEDSTESLDAIELATAVDAMDVWLCRGGALPNAWER